MINFKRLKPRLLKKQNCGYDCDDGYQKCNVFSAAFADFGFEILKGMDGCINKTNGFAAFGNVKPASFVEVVF